MFRKYFIAYFDFLGFKEFIYNNNIETQIRVREHIFRDIDSSLSKSKKMISINGKAYADLENVTLNVTNFSDTIIIWTNDDSDSSLEEFIKVVYKFNKEEIIRNFPVRGSIVYDEFIYYHNSIQISENSKYIVNSVLGKGIIKAYEKAEKQHWAGTVIDESFTTELIERGINANEFLLPYAVKYKVPYKKEIDKNSEEEYVLKLSDSLLDSDTYDSYKNDIIKNFNAYKKNENKDHKKYVEEKINNTLNFFKTFLKIDS